MPPLHGPAASAWPRWWPLRVALPFAVASTSGSGSRACSRCGASDSTVRHGPSRQRRGCLRHPRRPCLPRAARPSARSACARSRCSLPAFRWRRTRRVRSRTRAVIVLYTVRVTPRSPLTLRTPSPPALFWCGHIVCVCVCACAWGERRAPDTGRTRRYPTACARAPRGALGRAGRWRRRRSQPRT